MSYENKELLYQFIKEQEHGLKLHLAGALAQLSNYLNETKA